MARPAKTFLLLPLLFSTLEVVGGQSSEAAVVSNRGLTAGPVVKLEVSPPPHYTVTWLRPTSGPDTIDGYLLQLRQDNACLRLFRIICEDCKASRTIESSPPCDRPANFVHYPAALINDPDTMMNFTLLRLDPRTQYEAVVTPFSKDGLGKTSSTTFTTGKPIPPLADYSGTSLLWSRRGVIPAEDHVDINICSSCVLDKSHGDPTVAALLVCVQSVMGICLTPTINKPEDLDNVGTWRQAEAIGFKTAYRVTPEDWLSDLRKALPDPLAFSVGADRDCFTSDEYCNGYLPSQSMITVTIVICNEAGCAQSEISSLFTGVPDIPCSELVEGLEVALVAGTTSLAAAIVGIIVYFKRAALKVAEKQENGDLSDVKSSGESSNPCADRTQMVNCPEKILPGSLKLPGDGNNKTGSSGNDGAGPAGGSKDDPAKPVDPPTPENTVKPADPPKSDGTIKAVDPSKPEDAVKDGGPSQQTPAAAPAVGSATDQGTAPPPLCSICKNHV